MGSRSEFPYKEPWERFSTAMFGLWEQFSSVKFGLWERFANTIIRPLVNLQSSFDIPISFTREFMRLYVNILEIVQTCYDLRNVFDVLSYRGRQ